MIVSGCCEIVVLGLDTVASVFLPRVAVLFFATLYAVVKHHANDEYKCDGKIYKPAKILAIGITRRGK
jgi:hypothetical protein